MLIVCTVILVALFFTYTNGFHDTANAIATVVGTKVLTPRQAIMLAAVTNLLGAFFGLAVAKTISSGLVDAQFVSQGSIVCGLFAAIGWNLLTWYFGLPSSSSHALVGCLLGAAIAFAVCMNDVKPLTGKDGKPVSVWSAIKWVEVKDKKEKTLVQASPEAIAALGADIKTNGTYTVQIGTNQIQMVAFCGRVATVETINKPGADKGGIFYKVVVPMFTSPLFGFIGGFGFMTLLYILLRNWKPLTVNRVFGKLQLGSAAYMGFGHGMNDATKCMGIITLALVTATTSGVFADLPSWAGFLVTKQGSDPAHFGLGDELISLLPNALQFGYMPGPVDVKSQGIPNWVVVLCALTMAAGTAAGGWRIIKTMGHKLVKLQPVNGFAAETTAATILIVTGSLGMPISTTHAISTSIMGVGCAKRFSALKLNVVERIVWAWIMTIPVTAGVSFCLVYACVKTGILHLPK
ncbi:MAG TPA: inorganic phosphate transporter [Candidatus Sulfotelmatobacter sp.]|jgi:PiT family inorganic phosphate transporter|nr:inorganic phosphate transporter [Candidatus Sulfotelmatobacter sp.]